jgi:hypothetical protein
LRQNFHYIIENPATHDSQRLVKPRTKKKLYFGELLNQFMTGLYLAALLLSFRLLDASTFPDLYRHPYSNSWPHAPNTIRVEGLVDLSGPFATESTQNALGAMIWRDWINQEMGGLCLDPQRDVSFDGFVHRTDNCAANKRFNVSLVLWDIMRGGSLPDRLKYYRQWYSEICARPGAERPHVLIATACFDYAIFEHGGRIGGGGVLPHQHDSRHAKCSRLGLRPARGDLGIGATFV